MHHLAQTVLFLGHGNEGEHARGEQLSYDQEKREVESEEDFDNLFSAAVGSHGDDDGVGDEELNDNVDEWDDQYEPLEGTAHEDSQSVKDDDLDFLE